MGTTLAGSSPNSEKSSFRRTGYAVEMEMELAHDLRLERNLLKTLRRKTTQ
jgi:hypothetical protein